MSLPRTMPGVHREDLRGSTVTAYGRDMTPIARRVTLRWPAGQVSWQTPLAIEVNERGRVRRITISDATPRAILAMVLAEVALGLVLVVLWRALRARQTRTVISLTGRRRVAWTR
jgi:hypothetical protein